MEKPRFCRQYNNPPENAHRIVIPLADKLHQILQQGIFPNIRSFDVFDTTKIIGEKWYNNFDEDPEPSLCAFGNIGSILHFDILGNCTSSLPFAPYAMNRTLDGLRMRDYARNMLKFAQD